MSAVFATSAPGDHARPPRLVLTERDDPGYTRERDGDRWVYVDPAGRRVRSARIVTRLDALALPPAYERAWFALDPRAHIQATGFDARGRKQFRYHADFRAAQDESKYADCLAFGRALPAIRKRVEEDLDRRDLGRDRIAAAVVHLLDVAHLRIGNEQYARANKSFGATTLRNRHVRAEQRSIVLDFVGKSGKRHRVSIADRRVAALIRRCRDLPGQVLFQYLGDDGAPHPLSSTDVNAYLREHGDAFTAKHFRTWGGSVIAFGVLARSPGRVTLKAMMTAVSERLGNTPAIARKSYVHPAVIEAALDQADCPPALPRATRWLSREERGLMALLDCHRTDESAS